ncbi:hypothetical protein RHMOL_Rhmol10G0304400 [Rhododendron molle]|uniref:Uncharacterized protein n=1 Tax=Rhododendron molle TaxID=49168 RepID=A0ACC0M900_RHOML|nr:hypothetical protein RHMOL_Rhmol10G0304400 [Rhododendron molle]
MYRPQGGGVGVGGGAAAAEVVKPEPGRRRVVAVGHWGSSWRSNGSSAMWRHSVLPMRTSKGAVVGRGREGCCSPARGCCRRNSGGGGGDGFDPE